MSPLYLPPRVLPTDPEVVLDESRYPGAFSVDYTIASQARDRAIADCFTDPWTGQTTTRPRKLRLVPFRRDDGTNGKAHSYHWLRLELDTIAATYGLGSTGDTRYRWGIDGGSMSTYDSVQVRVENSNDFLKWPTTFNITDLWFTGWTLLGRESMSSTQNAIVVPGGRALKDFRIKDFNVQWFNNQLWGSIGRFRQEGLCNWNNAISRVVDIGGSDGSASGQWYIDSRAIAAGNYLFRTSMSSFTFDGGQLYLTPNSAGGLQSTGRIEGAEGRVEVNGLGVQAPEYCYNTSIHVGTGLLTGSPSHVASAYPGLIFWDNTSATWVCSNGTAWSLIYDGSAEINFDDTGTSYPTRPTVGVAGKVYRNMTALADFSGGTNGTNGSISYWQYWNGGWRGPSYWNQASLPAAAVAAGHVKTPVYIGSDVPGILLTGTRGSGVIRGSVALCGLSPGMVNGAWGGSVCVVDAKDPVELHVETSFVGSGRYPVRVHNSGAVPVVEARVSVMVSQSRSDDPPASGTQRVGVCRVVEGGETSAVTTADQAVPDDGTGIDVSGLDVYLYANERVIVDGWLDLAGGVGDATTAADVTVSHSLPSGATHGLVFGGAPTAATGTNTSVNQAVGTGVNLGTFPGTHRVYVKGWIKTGTTAGTWKLHLTRVATGASMPSVKAGSTMTWRKSA